MKFPFASILLILVFLSSCSTLQIEKRHYRDGFYISNNRHEFAPQTSGKTNNADNSFAGCSNQTDSSGEISAKATDTLTQDLQVVDETTSHAKEVFPFNCAPPDTTHQAKSDKDPLDRHLNIAKSLGIAGLILCAVGVLAVEVTPYVFPLLLIGIFCAILGLRFANLALQETKLNGKRNKDKLHPRRREAKNAFWLAFSGILIVMAYVLIRMGIAGAGAIAFAVALAVIALVLFWMYRRGLFNNYSDN